MDLCADRISRAAASAIFAAVALGCSARDEGDTSGDVVVAIQPNAGSNLQVREFSPPDARGIRFSEREVSVSIDDDGDSGAHIEVFICGDLNSGDSLILGGGSHAICLDGDRGIEVMLYETIDRLWVGDSGTVQLSLLSADAISASLTANLSASPALLDNAAAGTASLSVQLKRLALRPP